MATKLDAPILASLRWDFQREEENSPPIVTKVEFLKNCTLFFESSLASGSWQHWLMEESGKPVANASLKLVSMIPRPNRPEDTFGYLTNVYTIPEYRNQGIGSQLLQGIKDWSASEDLEVVIVWPSEKSRTFYQRLGFQASDEIMELGLRG
ncbi:GNAT family N-acetyltransferase [Neolewinella persica]|uniref:GNAT family N-acetyltransferase n=1 Tax=Neolewinella persica TaxID=70998 RepID=UPI0005C52CFD|nr:GNAT family N-acetyltransferase [Neolewinella persica]